MEAGKGSEGHETMTPAFGERGKPGRNRAPLLAVLAFFIGLALDLISAYPLGMHAVVFVAAHWATSAQRRFLASQNFMVIWAGFALIALIAAGIQWGLFSLFNWTLLDPKLILISTALTVFLYPAMVVPLSGWRGSPGFRSSCSDP